MNRNFISSAVFIFFLYCVNLGAVSVINVSQMDIDVSLLQHSEVFIDTGAKLDFEKASNLSDEFKPYASDFISRGYTTNEAVWVRFTLRNDSNATLHRVLHVDNSMLDSITLYEDANTQKNVGTLNLPPFSGILDFYFYIDLQAYEAHTYYLKLTSNSCATYFHLYLETKDKLWEKSINRQLLLSAFFALLFTLALYNLFIFFFTREKLYLFYTLFLLTLANNHLSYTAMTLPVLHNFLSNEMITYYIKVDTYFGIYYLGTFVLFLSLFARELMQLKRYNNLDNTLKFFIALSVLSMLLSNRFFYLLDFNIYLSFLILVFLLLCAIYLFYKKEENSAYIFFGFSINLFGHFAWLLYNAGVYIPQNGYWYFYEMSVATEAILFSIILSKKLTHTKALAESLQTKKILIRELHHRIKNNLQFIVSFYRLKLRKHLNNEGKEMLKEAEQSVRSIGKIHEILYAQNDLVDIDAVHYIKQLVAEIKKGYDANNISIAVEGSMSLQIEEAIYCGIIINELIINSIKYAFQNGSGNITASLTHLGKEKILHVKDNGQGFDYENKKESFGLAFIQDLITNELKGNMEFANNGGAQFNISWN